MISIGYPSASAPPGTPPAGGVDDHLGSLGRGNRRRFTIASRHGDHTRENPGRHACRRTRALAGNQGSTISARFLRLFAPGVGKKKRLAPKTQTAKWTMDEQQASAEQLATREPRHRPVSCLMECQGLPRAWSSAGLTGRPNRDG